MITDKKITDRQRQAFKEFMQQNKLKASSWAKKAGIAEATIRNYLCGRNQSLTSVNLEKLADAAGVKVQDLINNKFVSNDYLEDSGGRYINKALLIQSFMDVEECIAQSELKLSAKERANILIAWYELAQMIQSEESTSSSNTNIKDFIKNVASGVL